MVSPKRTSQPVSRQPLHWSWPDRSSAFRRSQSTGLCIRSSALGIRRSWPSGTAGSFAARSIRHPHRRGWPAPTTPGCRFRRSSGRCTRPRRFLRSGWPQGCRLGSWPHPVLAQRVPDRQLELEQVSKGQAQRSDTTVHVADGDGRANSGTVRIGLYSFDLHGPGAVFVALPPDRLGRQLIGIGTSRGQLLRVCGMAWPWKRRMSAPYSLPSSSNSMISAPGSNFWS